MQVDPPSWWVFSFIGKACNKLRQNISIFGLFFVRDKRINYNMKAVTQESLYAYQQQLDLLEKR